MRQLSAILLAFVLCGAPARAQTSSQLLTIQGVLRDGQGNLQTMAIPALTVSLYHALNDTMGFFTKTYLTVPANNGFFSIDVDVSSLATLGADLYVGVQVGGDSTELTRQHVTSVPFSMNASSLGGVAAAMYLTKTGDGSGLTNLNGASLQGGTVPASALVAKSLSTPFAFKVHGVAVQGASGAFIQVRATCSPGEYPVSGYCDWAGAYPVSISNQFLCDNNGGNTANVVVSGGGYQWWVQNTSGGALNAGCYVTCISFSSFP